MRTISRTNNSVLFDDRISFFCHSPIKTSPTWQETSAKNPPRFCAYAEDCAEEDILVADTEELENLDASKIRARRLNARDVLSPIENGTVNLSRRDVVRRTQSHAEDYWNVDGDRNLSEPCAGFTQFTTLNEKPPDGHT